MNNTDNESISENELKEFNEVKAHVVAFFGSSSIAEKCLKAFDVVFAYASGGEATDDVFRSACWFLKQTLLMPVLPIQSVNYVPDTFYTLTSLGRMIDRGHKRLNKPITQRILNE